MDDIVIYARTELAQIDLVLVCSLYARAVNLCPPFIENGDLGCFVVVLIAVHIEVFLCGIRCQDIVFRIGFFLCDANRIAARDQPAVAVDPYQPVSAFINLR